MKFVGKLEQLPLQELLQIVAANEKSGKITLTRRDAQGIIVLRHGKIIYAANSSARETLGFLLLSAGLVTEDQLVTALEKQAQSDEEMRLGTVLVEQGAIERGDLEQVVKHQLQKVIGEFNAWDSGFFKFTELDLPDLGEIEIDAAGLLLTDGLPPTDSSEEIKRRFEREAALKPNPAPLGTRPSLRAIMDEVRSPEFTGEVTGKILQFADRVARRGVLFFIRQGNFVVMHQFGLAFESGKQEEKALRRIAIPVDVPSVLAEAADSKRPYRGRLHPTEWNHYLVSQLGGHSPTEALAIPLVVNDRVLLVFYGDNGAESEPLASSEELEVLMLQAGLAMEKKLLEKRLEQFRKLRDDA